MTLPSAAQALKSLASLRLTTAILVVFFAEVLYGTLIQTREGLWESQRQVFENWVGGVPFLCVLASVNLGAAFLLRFRWKLRNAGLLVSHGGLVVLLVSGALGLGFSKHSEIDLGEGEAAHAGSIPGKWDILVQRRTDSGMQGMTVPLDHAAAGQGIDFGDPVGRARITGFVKNGLIGMDGLPIAMPRENDPAGSVPAISFAFEKDSSRKVSLDGNAPMKASGEGLVFFLQKRQHDLPFALHLLTFQRELHPGSMRAKSFESRVMVASGTDRREAVIRMNHPLRQSGFTLYQASWRTDEMGRERTILSVVENPVGSLPYWATLLIGLGLFIHFLPRLRPGARATTLGIGLLLASASPSVGADLRVVPRDLGQLPIQLDGRVRTFETFAEHTLLQIAGKSSLKGMDATTWLASVILDPRSVQDIPVFLVEHPDARDALGLTGKDRDRYSWAVMDTCGVRLDALAEQAAAKDPQKRDALEREFLRMSDAWYRLDGLVRALEILRTGTLPKFAPGAPPVDRFVDLALDSRRFSRELDSLAGLPPEARSSRDSATVEWFRTLFHYSTRWMQAQFPVVPWVDSTERPWASPGARVVESGLNDPALRRTILEWDTLRTAWLSGDSATANRVAGSLRDSVVSRAGSGLRLSALEAETWYNRSKPFTWAMFLFGFALVPALLGTWRPSGWTRVATLVPVLGGVAMVVAGMVLRMVVTHRPPVTNLYETFLFVDLVTVPVLLVVSWLHRWPVGRALAAASGLLLLLVARSFGADGDTMPVLVAVLDSNFWLTVHVLTITVGYGGVVASGVAAHWHLVRLRRGSREGGEVVRDLMAFGLFFTFIGTLLGGVWADQSWGRFWGWDPKENGALLIALWAAILFHARLAGQIGTWGFSFGAALSISTVLFAWFGVNLLGVGLHSYGFTQGTVWGLIIYAVLEVLFLAWAWWGHRRSP